MKQAVHRRWWFILLETILALSLCLAVVLSTTTVLQTRFIRLICTGNAGVKPSDYDAVLSRIDTLEQDVSYNSKFSNGTLDLYAARADAPQPLIVYAHGGYYVGDDKEDFSYYCQTLASYGYVVANINYALAPEEQYPTQILQVNEAVSYLLDHAEQYGIDPKYVFIGGDSAGAHLASQMGLYYTDASFREKTGGTPALSTEQLRGVILLCGYYDTETVRGTDFMLIGDSIWMLTGVKHYEGTELSARLSTATQISPDYPPAFVACGNSDPFLSQAEELITALADNGVAYTASLPGSDEEPLWHEYQRVLNTQPAQETMQQLLSFLTKSAGES